MKKQIISLISSLIIVILLNISALFIMRMTENPDNFSPVSESSFEELLIGTNNVVKLSDFSLSNVSDEENKKYSAEIIDILNKGNYKLASDFERALVRTTATRKSYIAELTLTEVNGINADILSRDLIKQAVGSTRTCEIVKSGTNYYVIISIISDAYDDIENCFYEAMYKLTDTSQIVNLNDYELDVENYSRSYPNGIYSFFFNSKFGTILFVLVILTETIAVSAVLLIISKKRAKRKKTKDSKRAGVSTV